MKIKILSSEPVYPLIDTVVGEEPILDEVGKPLVKMEPVLHESGRPLIDLVVVDEILTKQMRMQPVPVMRQIVEAIPNKDAEPDGMRFVVNVGESENSIARELDFVIGKGVFAELNPEDRRAHVEKEAILLYKQSITSPTSDSWMEGLE